MAYTFELLGISPVLYFFNHQRDRLEHQTQTRVEYLGSYHCTLDALLESVQSVPCDRGWNLDEAVETVIAFWLNNVETVRHWKQRLTDAGDQNLIISRLADFQSLQAEFDRLL